MTTPHLQDDESGKALGCCLMQDNPISFASRALSKTERRYAQIGKELFSILFACERFHYFIYGREVIIHKYHKLLISILNNDLRLQKNAIEVTKIQHKKMSLGNAFYRTYIKLPVDDDSEIAYVAHSLKFHIFYQF